MKDIETTIVSGKSDTDRCITAYFIYYQFYVDVELQTNICICLFKVVVVLFPFCVINGQYTISISVKRNC